MSLQFIAGGSGSGKTRYLYEKVIKSPKNIRTYSIFYCAGTVYHADPERTVVRLHPRHGLLNIDVLSFKRLAYRVFEDLGVQLPQVLDDMGKSMVIRKVAGKLKKELKLYRAIWTARLYQPVKIPRSRAFCQYRVSVVLAIVEGRNRPCAVKR